MKASHVVKFGYVMLALHLFGAGYYFFENERDNVLLFLVASILWVIGILVWIQVDHQEQKDK